MTITASSLLWIPINAAQAVLTALWTAGWIVVALVVRGLTRDTTVPLAMARRCWAPGLLWGGGIHLEVHGLDRVDFSQPHFFAANHQSIVDVPILFRALPAPLVFVLKEELKRVPFLGWYVSAMGMVFIRRGEHRRSFENLERSSERIADGKSVLIFPEGTRSPGGRIGRFKPGVFLPAIDSGVPVVPIALDGPGRILPAGGFRARPGTVRVAVGRPIATAGLGRGARHALSEQVRERVLGLHRQLGDA